jgi:hypothetical protein
MKSIRLNEERADLVIPESKLKKMKITSKYIFSLIFFSAALFFSSCKTAKKINQSILPKAAAVNTKELEDSIRAVNENIAAFKKGIIDFSTFNAKIKVESIGSNGNNPDLTAVVKIVKDSAIWVSLSATILSIEIYRALITKDSVILLNKQEKTVQYRSLDYLQEITQIPFDYRTLQDCIIGNPIFYGDSISTYQEKNKIIYFSTINKFFKNLFTLSSDTKLMSHCKLDDINQARNRTADITYDNYVNSDGINFSTIRKIIVSEKTNLNISLDFKKYEFNKELSLSFNVPQNYNRK